jgi:hypothetical protein
VVGRGKLRRWSKVDCGWRPTKAGGSDGDAALGQPMDSSMDAPDYEQQEDQLREVERAALAGARSVTSDARVVADSVEHAVHAWELAVLAKKPLENTPAWAFRVGANAARRLSGRPSGVSIELVGSDPRHVLERAESEPSGGGSIERRLQILRQQVGDDPATWLKSQGIRWRGRQLQVLRKVLEPGMTLRRAAMALGMGRSNLRRSFHSALERIRGRK